MIMQRLLAGILTVCLVIACSAQSVQAKVKFIYVNGIFNQCDSEFNFYKKADSLHSNILKQFETYDQNHISSIGGEQIDSRAGYLYWACTPGLQEARNISATMLHNTNHAHGFYGFDSNFDKRPVPPLLYVLLSPFEGIIHGGSSVNSAMVRSYGFNFLHDASWMKDNVIRDNLFKLYDRKLMSYKEIDPSTKFVLVGHSGGALLSFEYILYHLLDRHETETLSIQDIKGFISFGTQLSTVESEVFRDWQNPNSRINRFNSHFMRGKNFWIHITHRNDPLGFSIPINEFNSKQRWSLNEGFITSYVTQRNVLNRIPCLNLLNAQDYTYKAHGWYWNYPESFSKVIKMCYVDGMQHSPEERVCSN